MVYDKGTVLLLTDGRLVRVFDTHGGMTEMQFVDRVHPSYVGKNELDVELDLGHAPAVICQFYASWNTFKKLMEEMENRAPPSRIGNYN